MFCNFCTQDKEASAFYVSNKTKCKECVKLSVRKHRKENDSVREYDRKRGHRQDSNYLKEYRAKYPKKYKAHNHVNNGLRDGKYFKSSTCEECPSDFAVEAHHDDYDKPQVFRWLCARCHKIWHAANGEALNPT